MPHISPTLSHAQLKEQFTGALEFAQEQVRALTVRDPGYYPMYTVNGRWRHSGELWTNWCEGFLPGMMWIFAARTGEQEWLDRAIAYTTPLEDRQHDTEVHDLNFVLGSSYGRWHALTGDEAARQVVITAGETMGQRFREKGQYLRSFVSDDSCFVDIMMNVGILFRSALETGNAPLLAKAHAHCQTTRRHLVRGDGSTSHECLFDLDTGEMLKQTTHQGYRGDSCWVRGLAWSLYGFGTCYRHVTEPAYLATAELNAACFLKHLPANGLTPYDFDAPDGARPLDTSGSAIAASGLLQLAELTADADRAAAYRKTALAMLEALCQPDCLARGTDGWEGILKQQIYHLHKDLGVGESCMFGEYFFVEALDRALAWLG